MPAAQDATHGDPPQPAGVGAHPSSARATPEGFTSGYDTLIRVTTPPVWAAVLALGAVVAAIVAWAALGHLRQTVGGDGMVVPRGGVATAAFPAAGVVERFAVAPGDVVHAGQVLATVRTPRGRTTVVAPRDARVIELDAAAGQAVTAASPAVLLGSPRGEIEVVAYVPFGESGRLKRGQEVQLRSLTQSQDYLEHFEGVVSSVSPLPVTPQQVGATVGSPQLAQDFAAQGPVSEVVVALRRDGRRLRVSNDRAADRVLPVGALVDVTVVVQRQHPISEVFG